MLAEYRLDEGDLTRTEYDVIEKLAKGIASLMPPIDKYICLNCSADKLVERLRERGRDYESALGRAYAEKLKALYDAWYATLPKERMLMVDADEGVDLEKVLAFIGA